MGAKQAILICPERRPNAAFFARKRPLALTPILGPTLLDHALAWLAERGVKKARILASDRPEQIRREVGKGEKWGLEAEVIPEPAELTVEEARRKHLGPEVSEEDAEVILLDRLPQLPNRPLFESYEGFFQALEAWLPQAGARAVGARETAPGVWIGLRAKVHPSAQLRPPCWIGSYAWVQQGAVVGPQAFVEDHAMIDERAEVSRGWLGPATYLGALTHLTESFAWGNGLLKWPTGSFTEVVDPFLLDDMDRGRGFSRKSSWAGRLFALLAAILTSPVILAAWLRARRRGEPLFQARRGVVPSGLESADSLREFVYYELNGAKGLWRRWPQLWKIVRGEFTWVGNRPLDREQASQLQNEFERLWLAAPVGLFCLGDVYGCGDRFDDEARAHAGFYAARGDAGLRRKILWNALLQAFHKAPRPV